MILGYYCTNPECEEVTLVRHWAATRWDPADSTWGDGCEECGAELQDEAAFDEEDMAYTD